MDTGFVAILHILTMLNFMGHDFCGQLYSEP